MKAILTVKKQEGKKEVNEKLLFDTEKSRKICEVENVYGFVVEEVYLSQGGILFSKWIKQEGKRKQERLVVKDQELAKEYIAENHPETYMEIFGEVREA